MIAPLIDANIAIVGGGKACKALFKALDGWSFAGAPPRVMGVADINPRAVGLVEAQKRGIFTTEDYRDLYTLAGLNLLLGLTTDGLLDNTIQKTRPPRVKFLDLFDSRVLLDYLKVEQEKRAVLKEIRGCCQDSAKAGRIIEDFWQYIQGIARERNRYAQRIRQDLVEREGVLAQIVHGSTIPTFVINQDHKVTHWNRACEVLTGYSARRLVGTRDQWKPFRRNLRPVMADLILDGVTEEEVLRYYGTHWRKSALIDGAYEAEEHFPHLGDGGKWLFFTAAPIRAQDGRIVGAIETLWDRTEDKKAEQQRERHTLELAESERALAQIIQGSTVPTFVIDRNHTITHWNRAMENLTGRRAEEMVGTSQQFLPFYTHQRPTMADAILDKLDETEIQKLYGNWRKSALIEGAYESEDFFPTLGENGKWCFFTAAPIKAPDGTITAAIETLWDRTEYKRAEEERERYYTEIAGLCSIYSALNASPDTQQRIEAAMNEMKRFLAPDEICIFLLGDDGLYRLRYHTGGPESLCGKNKLAAENSIIHRVAQKDELTVFEDLPEADNPEIGLLQQEGFKSLAYVPVSTKDSGVIGVIRMGSRRTHHFSQEGKNILDLIGNRIGVAIENSLLNEEYIKSEEKYRLLFNNDPNPIFILNQNTLQVLDINHRAEDCYGYAGNELLERSFLDLGDPGDDELADGLRGLTEGQSIFFSKKKHFKKGRLPFYVNIAVSQTTYGGLGALIAATTDVTETVEQETHLIQASKMTTLGQMAAGIAHEINQPLNVIQVCADLLLKSLRKGAHIDEADLRTIAGDISGNVQRAAGIIKHMRDFSRQSKVVRNRMNINDPIQDVFQVMGHQLSIHNVVLDLDLDPGLPPIMAEHNRLEQVFINLVTNAMDAMEEKCAQPGGKKAEKRLSIRSFAENGRVVVVVSDTGIGMSRAVMDKIFEPFFTTKDVGKGTGLGVSISYGIVKDYDGTIHVESTVGQGTRFVLSFPALA